MANDFLDPIVQKVTNSKDGTFDGLVNSIGTDVYGSQMRLHLKQAIDTLGRAATQLNGEGASGGTGTGWTRAQIDRLGRILNAAGYAETGIGDEIAALIASLHGEKTLMSWTVSPETIDVPAGASLNSNSVRNMLTVKAIITDGLEDREEVITEFTLTGTLIQNSACPVILSFTYGGVTYSKTITVNVAARVPVSMTARWFGHSLGDTIHVPFGTTAEELKDAIYAELAYSDGHTERTTDFTVDGTISYKESSAIFVIYNKSASIAATIYAYGEMNILPEYAMVTYLLEGCVSSNESVSIEAGAQYYTSIVATSGSVSSIKVFVDGTDMSESFADSAGVLIPADSVMAGGRIVIIAENTAAFSVSYNLENCTSTNTATTIKKGIPYLTEIQPNSGYVIDPSRTKAVMNGNEYAYSESSRTITILDVQGDIVVYGVAGTPSVETFTVSNHLTNCVSSNSATSVEKGSSYSATITANEGYTLDGIVVTMSGTAITSSVVSGNAISIPEVTGNVIITATASETPTADVSYESVTKTLTIKTLPSDPSYNSGTKTLTIS